MLRKIYILLFISLFCSNSSQSQNLTGTWEGMMSDEFLQINIVQKNDELCGYTWDHFYNDKKNYCKAYFTGYYNRKRKEWVISGISFIENSGTHVLMNIRLWKDPGDRYNELKGSVGIKSLFSSFLSPASMEDVYLKKVLPFPAPLPKNMPSCFPEPNKSADPPLVQKTTPKKPLYPIRKSAPVVVKPKVDAVKKIIPVKPPVIVRKSTPVVKPRVDTVKKMPPIVKVMVDTARRITPLIKKDTIQQVKKLVARKNNTISRLPVEVRNITLNVYDNAVVDGDTVSIYYNGKLLVNKQRLTEKPIVINLELDERAAVHEITMYAENLGSIPPNTALIVVTAGSKRYELHSSASLTENAVLIFEYNPK